MVERTISASGLDDVDGTEYLLTRVGKVERQLVDWDNSIHCDDVLSCAEEDMEFSQSETVAVGHVLYFKSEFKADGYSLGDLVYSLPLAPGQKKQVVTLGRNLV
jgi:hypothetical protein